MLIVNFVFCASLAWFLIHYRKVRLKDILNLEEPKFFWINLSIWWLSPILIALFYNLLPLIFYPFPLITLGWFAYYYFYYKQQGLSRASFNKIGIFQSLYVFFPIFLSAFIFIVTYFLGVLDKENPSLIGIGVLFVVTWFVGFTPVEEFRNSIIKDRAGVTVGLEALDLFSYLFNLFKIFLFPLIIGVIAYVIASFGFNLSHTISYFIGVGFAVPAYIVAFQLLRPKKSKVTRGQEEGSYFEAKQQVDKIRSKDDEGIPFGDILLPTGAETKHFLFVGTTGSGKTVNIKLLINRAIHNIINRSNQRAIFFDAKRELYPYLLKKGFPESKIHVLNPFDQRFIRWHISKDVDTKARARSFSYLLVPEPKTKGDNAYFDNIARIIIQNVIHSFILTSDEREEKGEPRLEWTLRDVILTPRFLPSLKEVLGKHKETAYVIHQHLENEKTTRAILSTLDGALSEFEEVAGLYEHTKKKISLREWVNDENGSILLLGWDKENEKAIEPLNGLIFKYISDLMLTQNNAPDRRTWFFFDELRMISRGLPGLYQVLNMGREKGAVCVLGVLGIDGLNDAVGKDVAQEITSLCDNVAGLRVSGTTTAKWLSDMFGNAEIRERNVSFDSKGRRSLQEHTAERKTFLSGQFQNLKSPSKENELTISGFYMNAYTKPYLRLMKGEGVDGWTREVPKISREYLNKYGVVEHKDIKKKQRLTMWDESDLKRLNLNLDLDLLYHIEKEPEQAKETGVNWKNFRSLDQNDEPEIDNQIHST